MEKVRVGLVGSGFVSNLHMKAYKEVTGVEVEVLGVAAAHDPIEFAEKYGIPEHYSDYRLLLDNKNIDVIDICVPNTLHKRLCIDSVSAGKHIICEKPLTGYFGGDIQDENRDIGLVSKKKMYRKAVQNVDEIMAAVNKADVKLCYAEDLIYAPPVAKAKRLIKTGEGKILDLRSEESHSGSHADYARKWKYAGGGSLIRLGSHPLALVIHLKNFEGIIKNGKPINVKSVIAETDNLTKNKDFQAEDKKWMVHQWQDVEDWATVILTFEDGTKATVFSNDITLGGVVNTLDIYMSNGVIKCDMASNDACRAYAPSSEIFAEEYISEKLETKAGWSFPSPDEDWMRGYPQEIKDFMEAIAFDRNPISDGELGRQIVKVIYASYLSAEEGRRVDLN